MVQGVDDETGEPLSQRADDQPEAVQQRLQTYASNTAPLIAYYNKLGVLHQFAGTESNKIWPHVKLHLQSLLGTPQ